MRVYINKENKHKIIVIPLSSTNQDGYIVVYEGVVYWAQKEIIDKYYEPEPPYVEPTLNKDTENMLDTFKQSSTTKTDEDTKVTDWSDGEVRMSTDNKPVKVTNKDSFTEIEKNAWDYYENYISGYGKDDFRIAVLPLMIYLSKHHTPMTKVIVENNNAELVEGIESVVNNTFVED